MVWKITFIIECVRTIFITHVCSCVMGATPTVEQEYVVSLDASALLFIRDICAHAIYRYQKLVHLPI